MKLLVDVPMGIDLSVHNMSCRTHGVLDQCAAAYALWPYRSWTASANGSCVVHNHVCILVWLSVAWLSVAWVFCCAQASHSDDSLVRTSIPCAFAHAHPTMSHTFITTSITYYAQFFQFRTLHSPPFGDCVKLKGLGRTPLSVSIESQFGCGGCQVWHTLPCPVPCQGPY